MGQLTISELLDFTGGMNTLVAPHLISPREAQSLVNVDIRLGSLQSMPNLDYVAPMNDPFFFDFNGELQHFALWRSNVLWDGKYYWADGVNTGMMLENGDEYSLGLPTPNASLTQEIEGAGPHTGDFKYTYTFYSSITGAESAPAPLPHGYLQPNANGIRLTGFEPLPDSADSYRVYRIGGYLPVFALVDTIQAPTYLDLLDDTQIDGRLLTTLYTDEPPTGIQNLIEFNGRFYGSVGNRLYFSAVGNPHAWYAFDFYTMRNTITALGKSPGGLLIMGKFYVTTLIGSAPNNFRQKVLSEQLGCTNQQSVAYVGDSVVWLSHQAFCMSNGYSIADITSHKIDRIQGIYATGACVENETYYMSYKPSLFPSADLFPREDLYPDAVQGTGDVEQGIVALDFKRGNSFSYKMIDYDNIQTIGIYQGEVHVSTGVTLGDPTLHWFYCDKSMSCDEPIPCSPYPEVTPFVCGDVMFPSCLDFMPCSPFDLNRMNIYGGHGLTDLHYVSPELIDNSRVTLKEYDKVRILFKGIFKVKVVFDNGMLAVEQDIVSRIVERDDFVTIGIPNDHNKSYSIRFIIDGVGVIESIQYSWKTRELP